MKKAAVLFTAVLVVVCVILTAGCLTQSSSVPVTPAPTPAATPVSASPVVTQTPEVVEPAVPVRDISGEWYGQYDPSSSRFIELSVDKDGKVDYAEYKVDKNGNRDKIDVRKGSLTKSENGNYLLAVYNEHEQASYTLSLGTSGDIFVETAENGLIFYKNRDLARLPSNINF